MESAKAIPQGFNLLFSADDIARRTAELGEAVSRDFRDKRLTALVILKGSFVFAADLIRWIDLEMNVEFIGLRSYGEQTESSGVVQITMDVKHPLENEDVLIIEDIVDTGLTVNYLMKNLKTRNPASLSLVSFLHKPSRTRVPVEIDYLGHEVPDRFLIGYGLDQAGKFRNLPCIGYLDNS